MNKFLSVFFIAVLLSPLSFSMDATGLIEKVSICSNGKSGYVRTLQFMVDGKWFATNADYHHGTNYGYDNDITTAFVMAAYSMAAPVEVHFNAGTNTDCGITAALFYVTAGDYIKMVR